MREMLYSEIANFHGIPNIPDDPRSRDRGGNSTLRGAARTPARDVRTRVDPFRVPLRRGEHVRRRAAKPGLQLRQDAVEPLPPRMGPARRGRVHGGDRVHRHPLVHPAPRSRHAMAGAGLVDTRPPAVLGHDVLRREGKELRVQPAVAREAGSPHRGLFPAQGSPHKTGDGEPRGAITARNIPGSRSSGAADRTVPPFPNRSATAHRARTADHPAAENALRIAMVFKTPAHPAHYRDTPLHLAQQHRVRIRRDLAAVESIGHLARIPAREMSTSLRYTALP